jgi:peroxiredoxin
MKYYVKWIFVVLFMCSLTSYVADDKPGRGLKVGDVAPNFTIQTASDKGSKELSALRGHYVLISFWAGYDATSRANNASLSYAVSKSKAQGVEMVSVSFDKYNSIFEETIRKDEIVTPNCFVDTKGEASAIFKDYKLKNGFGNYLLDGNGIIIAKNISAAQLTDYINKQPA